MRHLGTYVTHNRNTSQVIMSPGGMPQTLGTQRKEDRVGARGEVKVEVRVKGKDLRKGRGGER